MDVEYQIECRNFLIDQYEKENEQADMQISMMAEAEMAREREEDKMYDEMIKNYENNQKKDTADNMFDEMIRNYEKNWSFEHY